MDNVKKFGLSFILALALHMGIVLMFGLGFEQEAELIVQKPLPEIIQASVLDDEKIIQEAERLQQAEINKQKTIEHKQQQLVKQRAAEEAKLQQARKQRQQEEQKARQIAQQRQQAEAAEKQRQTELNNQLAAEAARLAKIKEQRLAEQKRIEQARIAEEKRVKAQREAAEKKREQERLAAEKQKQERLAKQQAEKARQEQIAREQAAAASAKAAQDRRATITATAAIQRKVNNSWIRPMTSSKGLSCTIRVRLLSSGDVMDATVISSSGDTVFDRSAENAVRKASPLPIPSDKDLFSRNFRTFTFIFKPE